MEGLLNKNNKGQGVSAFLPCLLPPLALRSRGGVAHAGGGPGPVAWGLEGGRGHGEKRGGAMGG